LIALEENDIEEAKRNLLLSAAIKGSPQLNSFGPDMILAKKLLEKGERQIVLRYLDLCSNFWIWALSFYRLNKWRKTIRAGGIPDFGYNLHINMRLHEQTEISKKIQN
jgi:hypothetical protein